MVTHMDKIEKFVTSVNEMCYYKEYATFKVVSSDNSVILLYKLNYEQRYKMQEFIATEESIYWIDPDDRYRSIDRSNGALSDYEDDEDGFILAIRKFIRDNI